MADLVIAIPQLRDIGHPREIMAPHTHLTQDQLPTKGRSLGHIQAQATAMASAGEECPGEVAEAVASAGDEVAADGGVGNGYSASNEELNPIT